MALAGYSGTPLPRKLGIKPDARVLLIDAPKGFERTLGAFPTGVELKRAARGRRPFDVIVLFAADAAVLERRLAPSVPRLATAGGL